MSRNATDSTVLLGHGSGGQMMKRIIDEVFLDAFGSPELLEGNDATRRMRNRQRRRDLGR